MNKANDMPHSLYEESGASPLSAGLLRVDVCIEGATVGLLPLAFQC